MVTKTKIGKGLRDLLLSKPKKLALRAIENPKLARRIKNRILLDISKNSLLPSGDNVDELTDATIRNRIRLARFNKTGKWYSAYKSNLTFTGAFLRSFTATLFKRGKNVIFDMGPSDTIRKSYKTSKKRRKKKTGDTSEPLTNAELGKHLIEGGRDYTVISEENARNISKSVKAAILKEFKLNLKRK
jgi:hypothetical protein